MQATARERWPNRRHLAPRMAATQRRRGLALRFARSDGEVKGSKPRSIVERELMESTMSAPPGRDILV